MPFTTEQLAALAACPDAALAAIQRKISSSIYPTTMKGHWVLDYLENEHPIEYGQEYSDALRSAIAERLAAAHEAAGATRGG